MASSDRAKNRREHVVDSDVSKKEWFLVSVQTLAGARNVLLIEKAGAGKMLQFV